MASQTLEIERLRAELQQWKGGSGHVNSMLLEKIEQQAATIAQLRAALKTAIEYAVEWGDVQACNIYMRECLAPLEALAKPGEKP